MAISIWEFELTQAPLALPAHPVSAEAGAVVDFLGIVRETEDDAVIEGIEYEWHPHMALSQLERIGRESATKYPLLPGCLLHHRVGFVPAGEASLALRICCAHRGPALAATGWLVERLKLVVPIWKHPRRRDDSSNIRILPLDAAKVLR
jgi:molybdopterin synthase catalytic subunit